MTPSAGSLTQPSPAGRGLSHRDQRVAWAARGVDGVTLLMLPAAGFLVLLFVYPFLYGLWISFIPKAGGVLANYATFFSDPFLYQTIGTTLWLAVPVTLLNLVIAVPIALRVRLMRRQRVLTTILVIPITLGTVLVAQGLLKLSGPARLVQPRADDGRADPRAGAAAAQLLGRVPVAVDYRDCRSLSCSRCPMSAASTRRWRTRRPRWARPRRPGSARCCCRCCYPGLAITFCLSFVQAFSVFPSAVLLGAPSGPTRVISIAAYDAAFEQYDYGLASAIAMLMGAVQLAVVAAVLGGRGLLYRGVQRGEGLMVQRPSLLLSRLWVAAVWLLVGFFVVNLFAVIASVLLDSFATRWLGTWLPLGWTTRWYGSAWDEFQLGDVLDHDVRGGVPGGGHRRAAGGARRLCAGAARLPGQARAVMLLFLLPLLIPPITYGIPMATVLYRTGFAGSLSGVVLANLVPTVPFVVLVMIPFIEQIDPADRAGRPRLRRQHAAPVRPRAAAFVAARRAGRVAAGAGAHRRDVRADLPDRRADQPDSGGGAVLRRVRRRRARRAIDRRDGGGVHGDHAWCGWSWHCVSSTQPKSSGGPSGREFL